MPRIDAALVPLSGTWPLVAWSHGDEKGGLNRPCGRVQTPSPGNPRSEMLRQTAQNGLMPIALSRPSITCCLKNSSPASGASVQAAAS